MFFLKKYQSRDQQFSVAESGNNSLHSQLSSDNGQLLSSQLRDEHREEFNANSDQDSQANGIHSTSLDLRPIHRPTEPRVISVVPVSKHKNKFSGSALSEVQSRTDLHDINTIAPNMQSRTDSHDINAIRSENDELKSKIDLFCSDIENQITSLKEKKLEKQKNKKNWLFNAVFWLAINAYSSGMFGWQFQKGMIDGLVLLVSIVIPASLAVGSAGISYLKHRESKKIDLDIADQEKKLQNLKSTSTQTEVNKQGQDNGKELVSSPVKELVSSSFAYKDQQSGKGFVSPMPFTYPVTSNRIGRSSGIVVSDH